MKIEDCQPGLRVYVAGRFLLTQLNSVAEILDTRPPPENPDDNPAYPHGMVQVKLADAVDWSCREPWIGPEDLAPYPAPWISEEKGRQFDVSGAYLPCEICHSPLRFLDVNEDGVISGAPTGPISIASLAPKTLTPPPAGFSRWITPHKVGCAALLPTEEGE